MKKKSLFLLLTPLVISSVLTGCNSSTSGGKMPSITSFSEEIPDVYLSATTSMFPSLFKNETLSGVLKIYHINNNSIPYIDVDDGVKLYFLNYGKTLDPNTFGGYTCDFKDNKTIITNEVNNYKCIIDYDTQTMEFDDYGGFLNIQKDQVTPLDNFGFLGNKRYFHDITKVDYSAPKSKLVIDFTKYKIPLFAKDNKGYIPLEVCNNILNLLTVTHPTYVDHKIILNTESQYNNENQLIINSFLKTTFSEEYLYYCYNLNALTLDYNFGLTERDSRSLSGQTIKYDKKAYEKVSSYKTIDFFSQEPNVANKVFKTFVNKEYDDGGHTAYLGTSFIDNEISYVGQGAEANAYIKVLQSLAAERKKAGLDPSATTKSASAIGDFKIYEPAEGGDKDTAFLTMDSFKEPVSENEKYYESTISLVKYANEQLRTTEGKNVKNLVVDLSLNGGGAIYTSFFMGSWLTRGNSHSKVAFTQTGAFSDVTYKADVNLDGKYTLEDDTLPSTVENVYVIVSPCSFSCGNLLPCDLRDYALSKDGKPYAHFIGARSGGGGCSVRTGLLSGYGSIYQTSSNYQMCRKASTKDKYICNDGGEAADKLVDAKDIPLSLYYPSDFYNRLAIYNEIHT